jgi:hypothetical protein
MLENKELPSEYVSIRQVWLHNINRCVEAIANRAKPDVNYEANWQEIGNRTVVNTVEILYHSLVDHGEAIVRSEVEDYIEKTYDPKVTKIWDKWEGRVTTSYVKKHFPELDNTLDIDRKKDELKKDKWVVGQCWNKNTREAIRLYDFIIKTLNKYGMLFPEQPKGYTNVEMRSVE